MKMSKIFLCYLLLSIVFSGCRKLVQVDSPITGVSDANIFQSDATAISAITSIYASMGVTTLDGSGTTGPGGGITSLSLFTGLSSDEFSMLAGQSNLTFLRYYQNELSTNPVLSLEFWTKFYPIIYSMNVAIQNIGKATSLSKEVKQQLLGEAHYIRAFSYFYLLNLYGDVPLITSIDYSENTNVARTPKDQVYNLIVSDLTEAQMLLSAIYLDGSLTKESTDRVRPTKWAASALLARVFLFNGKWDNAEKQASIVINNTALFGLSSLDNAFLKASSGNKEAIWQLQPVVTGWNTQDARMFILPTTGPTAFTTVNPVYLSSSLLDSFEVGDKRKLNWVSSVVVSGVNYYYPYKYKSASFNASVTEYLMVFRLAELFLIRAEAKAQQNNISGARNDLNIIRLRAGLSDTPANDKTTLIAAIFHERQVELFTEWGHRWLDLKRSGTIDAIMPLVTLKKGGMWDTNDQLYPIPLLELQRNGQLVQNAGY